MNISSRRLESIKKCSKLQNVQNYSCKLQKTRLFWFFSTKATQNLVVVVKLSLDFTVGTFTLICILEINSRNTIPNSLLEVLLFPCLSWEEHSFHLSLPLLYSLVDTYFLVISCSFESLSPFQKNGSIIALRFFCASMIVNVLSSGEGG